MARVTIEDCLKHVNNRFELVHLAAKRVGQLRKDAVPLFHAPKNKDVVLALREIANGKVMPAMLGEELPPIAYYEPAPRELPSSDEGFEEGAESHEGVEELEVHEAGAGEEEGGKGRA